MANPHGWTERFNRLHEDLLQIFGQRLRSVVAYQSHFGTETTSEASAGSEDDHAHAMVLVESLSYGDLVSCAGHVNAWAKAGVGTPLFMTREEFDRSLDAFPLEFSAIAAHHVLVAGADPFAEARIDTADLRKACETQTKSHLLHLREGFLEARGEPAVVARMIAASIAPLRTLLLNLARLDGVHARSRDALVRHAASLLGVPDALFERLLAIRRPQDLDTSEVLKVYTAYLDAIERLARWVDAQ